MTRSLLFVTGTRADFGKIEPLARAASDAGFKVTFFVTGMHMLRKYGETRREVRRFKGADVHEFINQAEGDSQDFVLSKTVSGFADWLSEHRPDLVLIHGDRVEALAGALVCAMRYVPCAHIEGGEVSGTIDEVYRHCTTKLARYHFVSSDEAARRVEALGEDPENIFAIGSPELDVHGQPSEVSLDEVRDRYAIPFDSFGIAVFHPVTSELDSIGAQAGALFDALAESERPFVVILPNNDPGSELIFDVIEALPGDRFRVLPSMRFSHFSTLLREAAVVVGNSSLGVREAPFLGVPSINIGTRQTRRSRAPSVLHVDASDSRSVLAHLSDVWGARYEPDPSFGRGSAAKSFVHVISHEGFWSRPRQKVFHDLDGSVERFGIGESQGPNRSR